MLEALKVKNMTVRPKARQDEQGRGLRNGAAQKAGVNRSILSSARGSIALQLKYKAARQNTLLLSVPAAYSSQECSWCGHTHPADRDEQRFVCQRCGFEAHADANAACVIAGRGISLVREHEVLSKPKKRDAYRVKREPKNKTGLVSPGVPVEGGVRRGKVKTEPARRPKKQERLPARADAPTAAPPGV